MKIVKIFGIIVIVAVAIFFVAGMFMPNTAHVERSIVIDASPESIFEELNTTQRFNNWSPWAQIDPNTEYVYEGPESGIGAKMSWTSDHQDVGDGAQWIIESKENQKVVTQLEFGDFEGDFKGSFIIEPNGDKTNVVWAYDADVTNLIGKFFNPLMEGMLGPVYEQGLANLKNFVEAKPKAVEEEPIEDIVEAEEGQ